MIAESIDPSAVRQFIIQYNIAMQKQLAAHPELANDEVALQEVNAALFKEYLPLLQKSEPTIKQPVRWKNALGELNANLDISIADPAKSSSSTNKDIKSLNFDVKLRLMSSQKPQNSLIYLKEWMRKKRKSRLINKSAG